MTTSTCISRPFHLTHSHSHKSALCTHPRSIICTQSLKPLCIANSSHCRSPTYIVEKKPHRWKIRSGDEDFEGEREYEEEEEEEEEVEVEVEEAHNWNDYLAYNNHDISPNDFNNGQMGSFVNTQGWKSEVVVHHKINQDEFHKIRLLHCDFFIRKALDYDDDVFDFREMYVTPPEMDVYSIPEVVGKMPDKYVRLRKTDYGCYNVIELPVDRARDKFAKTEFEVMKNGLGMFS